MKFNKIFIEVTNACGLSCSFCTPQKLPKNIINTENFSTICQKITSHTHLCALHILGDPLTLDNLLDYLNIATAHNIKLDITTSGFYLNPTNITLLLKHPSIHQINISLTSVLYQKNYQNLKQYLENVFLLCSKHQILKSQKFINLRLWNLDKNFNPPSINQPIYQLLTQYFNTPLKIPKTRLSYKIHLIQQPFFEWPNIDSTNSYTQGFCYGGSKQLGILNNGDIVPCCFDTKGEIKLGNIFKQSLEEIYNTQRYKMLLKNFQKGVLAEELCKHCSYPLYLSNARNVESL